MRKVLIASTAHQNSDDMVYYRYARFFRDSGYEVVLVTMESDVEHDMGIRYIDIPYIKNPIRRMSLLPKYINKSVLELSENDIFIFFSIDLNHIGITLSKRGIKVIKVFAEDYSRKAFSREWIPKMLRGVISKYIYMTESKTSKNCYLNVFVDSATASNYNYEKINSCVIPNYPINVGLVYRKRTFDLSKSLKMVYVGEISEIRGINFILSMAEKIKTNIFIDLYGNLSGEGLKDKIKEHKNINYCGVIPYDEILSRLNNYDIGLAIFKPCYAFDYIGENTTKIFEYMQAGLPIITSDIGLLKEIVEEQTKSGIAIDYSDFDRAFKDIEVLLCEPHQMMKCSANGRESFLKERNWEAASKVLLGKIEGVDNE